MFLIVHMFCSHEVCKLRRVNQRYVIATKTKIRIKNVKIPPQLGDEFFRRQDLRTKKSVDKIFA
ncbi:hypothetical protein FTX61_21515, partial [Nitriliruptoraceae bacterium ZYF776]|nr:hypothetical protein [Profundirhabdus halotolerans]